MSLNDADFASMLADSKRIEGDIHWSEDEDKSPARVFRAEVETGSGWPLFVQGRYNRLANKLTYALILRGEWRVYALDTQANRRSPQASVE